jgi:hypothetical protein
MARRKIYIAVLSAERGQSEEEKRVGRGIYA